MAPVLIPIVYIFINKSNYKKMSKNYIITYLSVCLCLMQSSVFRLLHHDNQSYPGAKEYALTFARSGLASSNISKVSFRNRKGREKA